MILQRNFRNSVGASTMILIAVCTLAIILLGYLSLFVGRLISGNHQLNYASDAGILNAAKYAVAEPAIALADPGLPNGDSLPYFDFAVWNNGTSDFDFTDANGKKITVKSQYITPRQFNIMAGQMILCLLNAQAIGTTQAANDADQLFQALKNIEISMSDKQKAGILNKYFDDVAGANNLNMLGGKASMARKTDVKFAYAGVGKKFPTNLFFDNNVLSQFNSKDFTIPVDDKKNAVIPIVDNPKSLSTYDVHLVKTKDNPHPVAVNYVAGYEPIKITVGSKTYNFQLIPNNPQRRAHLFSKDEVTIKAPGDNVLPNAFYVGTNANASILGNNTAPGSHPAGVSHNKSSGAGAGKNSKIQLSSVACAIEGVGGDGYIGCIPAGYIRFKNGPDMQTVTGVTFPTDGKGGSDFGNLITNTYMLSPDNFVYVGMPLPLNKDGSLNTDKIIFAVNKTGLDELKTEISNSSAAPSDQKTVSTSDLYEGPGAGNKANLADVKTITDYVAFSDSTYDGDVALVNNGITYSADTIRQVINTCASNLGVDGLGSTGAPTGHLAFNEANGYTNGSGYTAAEYVKATLIVNFEKDKAVGHVAISAPSQTSGMGTCPWYDSDGKQIAYSVPNNYLNRKAPGSPAAATNVPHVCQLEVPNTPYNYLLQIDNTVKAQNGGKYPTGHVTMDQFLDRLLKIAQEINPNWTKSDLIDKLQNSTLPLGTTVYLHRDLQTGDMVFDKNVPYDKGLAPDGNGSSAITTFATDGVSLNHYIINTSAWKEANAYLADCNVEAEMWRAAVGDMTMSQGASFVPATGYHQLLGEVDFFENVTGNIRFGNPN